MTVFQFRELDPWGLLKGALRRGRTNWPPTAAFIFLLSGGCAYVGAQVRLSWLGLILGFMIAFIVLVAFEHWVQVHGRTQNERQDR